MGKERFLEKGFQQSLCPPAQYHENDRKIENALCQNTYLTIHMNKLSTTSLVAQLICRLCNLFRLSTSFFYKHIPLPTHSLHSFREQFF